MPVNDPLTCKSLVSDLITKVASVNHNKGLGVLYWEPQAYNSWKGYGLGAFDISGKPTAALDAFK
jgi:arabinogalactan endo-1,4-beta-galactosidase